MWNPNQGYRGNLMDLFTGMMAHLPPKENLKLAHKWLVEQLDDSSQPLRLVRYGYKISQAPNLDLSHCSDLIQLDKLGLPGKFLLTTDNEATVSFYESVRFWDDIIREIGKQSLRKTPPALMDMYKHKCITNGTIKRLPKELGVAPKVKEEMMEKLASKNIRAEWCPIKHAITRKGSLRNELQLKYSHLMPAKPPEILKNGSLDDVLKILTYRMLSPLNIFPTPKKKFTHDVICEGRKLKLTQNDIGEHYVEMMEAFLFQHMGEDRELWEEYCLYGGKSCSIGEFQDRIMRSKLMEVNIVPKKLKPGRPIKKVVGQLSNLTVKPNKGGKVTSSNQGKYLFILVKEDGEYANEYVEATGYLSILKTHRAVLKNIEKAGEDSVIFFQKEGEVISCAKGYTFAEFAEGCFSVSFKNLEESPCLQPPGRSYGSAWYWADVGPEVESRLLELFPD